MECMEAKALKSNFMSEIPMKTNYQQAFSDDIWCVTGLTGTDDFSIDEFFDLPNEDTNKNASFLEGDDDDEEEEEEEDKNSSQHPILDSLSNSPHFSPDLAIPVDDVQELELWSHLMDDSVPEVTLPCPNPAISFQLKKTGFIKNRFEPGFARVPFIASAVPVKPRTKRPRTPGTRTWITGSPSISESPSSSSSSSSLVFTTPVYNMGMVFTFEKRAIKKPKKKPVLVTVSKEPAGPAVQRRCAHCQVTKTPQWRAGPSGPKTLCNACGVRFKSGRLFPEYRPACSPTFLSEIHSNSHRKVLEMRRKRDITGSMTGSTSTISS